MQLCCIHLTCVPQGSFHPALRAKCSLPTAPPVLRASDALQLLRCLWPSAPKEEAGEALPGSVGQEQGASAIPKG